LTEPETVDSFDVFAAQPGAGANPTTIFHIGLQFLQ